MVAGLILPQSGFSEEKKPSPALLEFLGEFSEADDEWVDPTLLPPLEEIDAAPEADEEDDNEG